MLGITKESLHKNTRLVSRVHEKNGDRKLSGQLLNYLEGKYQLLPRDMLRLRAVNSNGSLGNLAACFIRIYDQEMSARNGNCIRTYDDLDKQPDLILYHGYILENDFVYVTRCDTHAVSQTT